MDGFTQAQADDFLGPAPEKTPNMSAEDADRFLGPAPTAGYQPPAGGAAERDHWLQTTAVGRVLNAFGQGAEDAWGTSNLGFTPEAETWLKKYGVFNDASKGQTSILRSVNEALFRPAAAALDAAMRLPSAAYAGAQAAVIQGGAEAGDEEAGRELAMLPDAFAGSPGMFHTATPTPADMARAADLGVVGQSEAAFKGTAEPVPPPAVRVADPAAAPTEEGAATAAPGDPLAAAASPIAPTPEAGTSAAETAAAPFKPFVPESPFPADTRIGLFPPDVLPEPVPTDVHGYARMLAPETFQEYDPLLQHRDDLREQIADSQAELQRNAESQAPGAAQIADLEARMQDATPRLAKKYQARLDALIPARDAFLADDFTMGALTRDTPEIAALRQQLLETDYRLRDLAPDVSEAYRKAAEKFPAPEQEPAEPAAVAQEGQQEPAAAAAEAQAGPVYPAPKPEEPTPGEVQPAAAVKPEPPAATRATEPQPAEKLPTPEPVASIAADVSRKLQAAGRPAEEADAAGRVTEALWRIRAEAFGGKKGTAEEMYAREAPDIVGESARAGVKELAQRGARTLDQKAPLLSDKAALEKQGQGALFNRSAKQAQEARDAEGNLKSSKPQKPMDEGLFSSEAKQKNLFQGRTKDTPQGKIKLTADGRSVITLMRTANASTFIHETAHDWLERMMRDATDPDAPQHMRDDAATVRKYLKVEEGAQIPTKAHEKFARSFERYFMEGRAPSSALADVFAKFKDWLTSIYQTVGKLNAPITADIRDVFDRLLTGEKSEPAIVPETPTDLLDRAGAREIVNPASELPREKPTDLYTKVKEPERLASYLRRIGGINDVGGDVRHTLGGAKFRPGLINSKGMSLDEATEKAWEAGYFPEFGDDNRPAINDLLDALAGDLNGYEPRYSHLDQEQLEKFNEAKDSNAEVDRLSHHYGIDTKGMTKEQFRNALSEHLSLEERYAEIRSQEEAHEEAFGDYADEARQWMDEHYGGWDSDAFYGIEGPRTEQELEAERGSQDASGSDGQSAPGDEQPGPTPSYSEPGQEGGGSRGAGSGPAGQPQPEAQTGGSATPLGPTEDGLIDKAGNIRLDNLNQPEQVNQVIRDAAEARDDFIEARRGVISDQQVLDLADALGMTAADLNRRQLGQAFNAEQVMAARKLLVQSAIATREAMAKAATGSDEDVRAYAEARARHLMIQEQVSGITAEAGRALRAFRSLGDGGQTAALGDFLQASTGRTLFQLRREAQAGALLDTPQQVSKFVQDSNKATWGDMAFEYWINGLISGPATHTTYAIGNALLALWKAVPETAMAAAIGAVRGSEGSRVYGGEVQAALYGIMKGQRDGLMAAWKAAKTGLTTELPGESEAGAQTSMLAAQPRPQGSIPNPTVGDVTIPLGTVIRLPSRVVASIHSYFRSIGYSEAIAQLAYRQAMDERLTGADFDARVANLTTNPPADMMESARNEATVQTMMGGGGEFTRKFAELTNTPIFGFRLLKVVDPFVKIGSNVIGQGLMERSPLGILDPEIRANLMGKNGRIAQDTQIARIAVGSALGAAAVGLAAQGYLTGGGPSDPKEAAMWRMTGKQPYSVRIGDTWYSAHRLGPLAMLLGVGADMYELGDQMGKADTSKVGGLVVASITKGILNESFMRGPADLIQALEDPDRYGAKYVRDQLGTLLPFSTGMSQVARAVDPYMREARTTLDSIKARVPFMSEELQPRIDIWGQPMPNKDDLGFDGATAIAETRVNNDPVNQTMLRLGVFPAMPERKIVGVQLTDQQYTQFATTAGRMAKMRLDALVNTPGFSALPDGVQAKVITDTMSNARRTAAELTKMQNPEIIQQGIAFKRAVLTQGRRAAMAKTE